MFKFFKFFGLLLVVITDIDLGVVEANINCTPEVCATVACKESTGKCENGVEMLSPTPCNCCPKLCIVYLKEGDRCTFGTLDSEPLYKMCGPGLMCQNVGEDLLCAPIPPENSPCVSEQIAYDEARIERTVGHFQWRPQCDAVGLFSPVRCVPGSTCHCLDDKGNRIFGEVKSEIEALASNMNCACSRNTALASVMMDENSPKTHCLPNGNYDTLQCIDQQCFCMDPKNYEQTGSPVHISELSRLSCYIPQYHQAGVRPYYQVCDSRRLTLKFLVDQLTANGIYSIGVPHPSCDLDGFYTSVQQNASHKFCTDRQGIVLENFILPSSEEGLDKMTCNCARSRWLMKTLATDLPSCDKYGNFEPVQCRRGICYCVDENGIQQGNKENFQGQPLDCSSTN